ncbi:MAG: hypothetical protein ACI9JZ_001570, partial [Lentimonas sp.]
MLLAVGSLRNEIAILTFHPAPFGPHEISDS